MLDKNLNLIVGARSSGRSSFLFAIADLCKSNGLKTIFYGATDEFANDRNLISKFEMSFFYRHRDERITKNIKEICERDNISYLIIDDIGFFSQNDIKILQSIKCPKICSCENKIPESLKGFNKFELLPKYEWHRTEQNISVNGKSMKVEDFFKTIERDIKLNSILKYE